MKKRVKKLHKAPIIEALIDIQVVLVPTLSLDELVNRIPEEITAEFPRREERRKIESSCGHTNGKFQFSAGDHGTAGVVLRDNEKTKALQVRLDGFGFSHLQPYSDFPTFEAEARKFWNMYRGFAGVSQIRRITLLYINILESSKKNASLQELKKLLKSVPDISDLGDKQTFNSRIRIGHTDAAINAIITQETIQNVKTEATGIQFQIAAFKQFSASPNEDELWDAVEQLREFKNDIFFDLVTSEQIEKFEPEYFR